MGGGTFILLFNWLSGFIQIILQQAIVLMIAKEHWTNKRLLLTVLIIFSMHTVSMELLGSFSLISQIIWILLLFAAYKISYKISVKKSALMAVSQMLANTGLEYVIIFIISLSPLSFQMFLSNNQYILRGFVIILYLAFYLIAMHIFRFQAANVFYQIRNYYLVYFSVLYILVDAIILYIERQIMPFVNNSSDLLIVILLIILFVFNLAYINRIKKTALVSQQLELKELYSASLEKSIDELRGFKHDFMNIVNTLNGYLELKDYGALENYIADLNVDILKIKTTNIVNEEIKNIPLLYGMLLTKISIAELQGISFDISIRCDIDIKFCSVVDYSRMVGILLDNALETASTSKEKTMFLNLFSVSGRFCTEIVNSCDELVDISQIYHKGYTTKSNHHGIGLTQIKMIIGKYRLKGYSIELKTALQNNCFSQIIQI